MKAEAIPFEPRLRRRRRVGRLFQGGLVLASLVGLAFLIVLIGRVLMEGLPWFSWNLLNNFPSVMFPEKISVHL